MFNTSLHCVLLSTFTISACCLATHDPSDPLSFDDYKQRGAYANPPKRESVDEVRAKLLNVMAGEWISRALYTATKLEIADHLESGAKSAAELAALSQADSTAVERLLHLLCSVGIFEEASPGLFANNRNSQLLRKSHPDSLYNLSLFYGEDVHGAFDVLTGAVEQGKSAFEIKHDQPVFQYFKEHPERAARFQLAMREKSQAVAKSVAQKYPFAHVDTLYDIGGGLGQFLQMLLDKHTHLKGILFELPEVVNKVNVAGKDYGSRFNVVSGDFFKEIPAGGDAYLLKSVLHDWDDAHAEQILQSCRRAMQPGSKLLIVEIVTDSVYANSMDIVMLAMTGGRERSLEDFKRLLKASGFTLNHVYSTSTEFSILECGD